jgi:hypothetical protein
MLLLENLLRSGIVVVVLAFFAIDLPELVVELLRFLVGMVL